MHSQAFGHGAAARAGKPLVISSMALPEGRITARHTQRVVMTNLPYQARVHALLILCALFSHALLRSPYVRSSLLGWLGTLAGRPAMANAALSPLPALQLGHACVRLWVLPS